MDTRVREDKSPLKDVRHYIDERIDDGVLRVHLDLFRDPEIFDLEMKYIYEKTWVFLGFGALAAHMPLRR